MSFTSSYSEFFKSSALQLLHGDHLGSRSVVDDKGDGGSDDAEDRKYDPPTRVFVGDEILLPFALFLPGF